MTTQGNLKARSWQPPMAFWSLGLLSCQTHEKKEKGTSSSTSFLVEFGADGGGTEKAVWWSRGFPIFNTKMLYMKLN